MLVQTRKRQTLNRQVHDLSDLMSVYECNYIRLRQLIPDFESLADCCVSRVTGALDLHLQVLERSKYTTTLKLTYQFTDELGRFPAPDLQVRFYHDARLAEVLSCGRTRGKRTAWYDRNRMQYSLDERWHINRFLQKWLGYCLRQGHRYVAKDKSADIRWSEMLGALGACAGEK
jgi:uncharacterized protein YqiB (DUF1249 family)